MDDNEHSPPDEPAFVRLYEATYAGLRRFLERRIDPAHVDDVLADVYVVAWRRFADVPTEEDGARAWLYGVAHRTLLSARRSHQRHAGLPIRVAEEWPDATAFDPDLLSARLDLATAWKRLSRVHQEAIALTVWDGLAAPQAAEVLGISPVAFRLRLSRARRALRALAGVDHFSSPALKPARSSS